MNNKLLEIAEKAYMDMITSKGSEQDKKDSLYKYFAEYARSKVPDKKTVPPEDSYDLGYNDATFDMVRSIDQDLQSLNK